MRRAVVAPGHHTVRFETETSLLLFAPRCGVKLDLKAGVTYDFYSELEKTRLRTDVLGVRWRQIEATGFLSVHDPASGTRKITLPCADCLAFNTNGPREQATSCQRYRADLRVEQLCEARGETDRARCFVDGKSLVLVWRRAPDDVVMFVPGIDADYTMQGRRDAVDACIASRRPDVESCMEARGWEPVL